LAGQQVFNQIGCNACHTPSINSGSTFYGTGLNNVPVNAYSDFLIHNMGTGRGSGEPGPCEWDAIPDGTPMGSWATHLLPA
jgi:CxxC motif-containing protein (DUF1111 family)